MTTDHRLDLVEQPVHVLPVNDLIDHDLTDSCPCGPADQSVIRDDGSVGWIVVHASLDGS